MATSKAYERGFVPSTLYFLIGEDKKIYGALHIRHELNDYLLNYGGHIGYGIRPSQRKKGYATKMLSQSLSLPIIKKLGIKKVLITCDKTNIASAKTIINNGGILENEVMEDGEMTQRYWIDIY
jgi:predicted acetyltransferase